MKKRDGKNREREWKERGGEMRRREGARERQMMFNKCTACIAAGISFFVALPNVHVRDERRLGFPRDLRPRDSPPSRCCHTTLANLTARNASVS